MRCDSLVKGIDHARHHPTHPANPGVEGQALNEGLVEASALTGPADPVGRSITAYSFAMACRRRRALTATRRLNASATGGRSLPP